MAPSDEAEPPLDEVESTSQLIDRARAGDAEAVTRLCEQHLAPLRRWASGRLPRWARDIADTDDFVQDALIQTFRRIEAFEPRGFVLRVRKAGYVEVTHVFRHAYGHWDYGGPTINLEIERQ